VTGDFRDPSEEMKRLLRRIEEMDEAQQLQSRQAQSLESSEFGEQTHPLADSGDHRKPALQLHGKYASLEVSRKSRKRRLARRVLIAVVVAAVVAAISIAVMRDRIGVLQSVARGPFDSEPKVQPLRSAASNAINPELAKQPHPRLTVALQKTSLTNDQVWPIGLRTATEGDGGTLVINGLAVGATLSVGRPLSANGWELNASELNGALIIPPSGFVGTMDLTIDLRLGGVTVDKQSMQIEWLGKATSAAPQVSTVRMGPGDVSRLLMRGEALLAGGEIAAARAVFKRLADNGEPRAAFALAETYEQSTLERLGAKGLVAEMEVAQRWYERAKELGSIEAQHRLDLLARESK
jgi:hypothetical protein